MAGRLPVRATTTRDGRDRRDEVQGAVHGHRSRRPELGRFWASVTGARTSSRAPRTTRVTSSGEVEGMGIAICPVPEEKTVKNRVHLDVHTDSVDSLLALGADPAPGYDGRPVDGPAGPRGRRVLRLRARASCRRTAATS